MLTHLQEEMQRRADLGSLAGPLADAGTQERHGGLCPYCSLILGNPGNLYCLVTSSGTSIASER